MILKQKVKLVLLVLCAIAALWLMVENRPAGAYEQKEITVAGKIFNVEIADTEAKRSLGLSERSSLKEKEGMLFIFPTSGFPRFWMKDMNFPIDIVWLNERFEVVGIEKNVSPDTYPQTFTPSTPVKYVLEVPANTF